MEDLTLLEANYDVALHTYEIKDFERCKQNVANLITSITTTLPENIHTTEDRKLYKSSRTMVNKYLKAIKDGRIQVNKVVLGNFNSQVKELENALESSSEYLTEKINAFDEKEKSWTLTGKSTNKQILEEIKRMAWELYQVELKIK